MANLIRNSGNIEVSKKYKKRKTHCVWTPLVFGQIKINVDDSFLGNSNRWGIKGVFRDLKGNVILQFGKEVSVQLAIHTELIDFREESLVVAASRWRLSHSFVFELNSKSVISWVTDPSLALWRFQNVLWECYNVFGTDISWSLSHIGRKGSDAADVLARMGFGRLNFIEFVWFVVMG